jgi:hypothetical protein
MSDDDPIYNGPVKVRIMWVSPARAKAWLARNTHNRRLRDNPTTRIARDITNDAYVLNGETIKFADDGVLLDGQHRLEAVVVADKGVWMVVVMGLPRSAQHTVDRVQLRNIGDALRLKEPPETNTNVLAGVLANTIVLKSSTPTNPSAAWPSGDQALAYLEQRPEVREAVSKGENLSHILRTPSVSAGAMYHIFAAIDEDDADDFYDKLASGADLQFDSSILKLREFMFREAQAPRRVGRVRLHAYYIKCWNAYRKGLSMQVLGRKTGGSHPEAFPEPV